ncbi:MAG: hypothetical protein COV47_01690 [Candidatus Diapherotrites archaeon CG11_big_fil_rev_8_21_14_0_20_37_9]|nr:MAG: hypothetical protein COV47_01690 [Candidatus Diapherotrites archaeon CG11_big_fil_rev_8_21_14_0_20_37_9]
MALFEGLILWTKETFGSFGPAGLFILAFAESSFFPVPPDILIIAFSLAAPSQAFFFALIATIGSVLGALFGYFLGQKFGEPLLLKFAKKQQVEHVQKLYKDLGFWAVVAAGFSPIPFKIFTILSGIMELEKKKFVIACIVSRAGRFFLVAGVIYFFGAEINTFLNQYFEILTLAISLPVIIFVSWKFYRHRMQTHGKII